MSKELLVEYNQFKVSPQMITESLESNGGKLIVSGVLQRANAKNQNGRIYSKKILEREISKYIANEIAQRRALGELDHHDCLRPTASILCENGWKLLSEIADDERVCTLNTQTGDIEIHQINKKIHQSYTGKMIHIKGKNIDTMVTPNHRFYLVDRYGVGSFVTALEIYNNRLKYDKSYIPKHGFNGIDIASEDMVTIRGVDSSDLSKYTPKERIVRYGEDVDIDAETWYKFLGLYISEGNCIHIRPSNRVAISQVKERGKEMIRDVLSKFPESFKWTEYFGKEGKSSFECYDPRLARILEPLGYANDKYIPFQYKNTGVQNLKHFYTGFLEGDGTIVEDRGYIAERVFTTSDRLADDLQEVMLKAGMATSKIMQIQKDSYIRGRRIKSENSKPVHRITRSKAKGIYLDRRNLSMKMVDYDGEIACVSVPNETFFAKDNGKAFWTGNSSVVNLKNVSHNILECWWVGDDLMGKIEILNTPAGNIVTELFKANITVGISSRGMGSVKTISEHDDTVEVQDDFSLVTFDFVSNPSTHGAFVKPVAMTESVNINNSQETLDNKISNTIRDIICELSGVCCINK